MWSDWLTVWDCSFSLSASWSPLSVPTVLPGFLLPWTWVCLQGSLFDQCGLKKRKAWPKSWELCFVWQTKLRMEALKTTSHIVLRNRSEEVREEPGYRRVLQQKPGSQNIKRLLLIKENQTSQVNEFSSFLPMRRCKSLVHWIPLICTLTV